MATRTEIDSAVCFASKLQSKLGQGNLFYSPYSIQVALGMCAAGAKGETANCLSSLLECPTDAKKRNEFFGDLVAEVNSGSENRPYELVTANALWKAKGLPFTPLYEQVIADFFQATTSECDYENNPEGAVKEINEWCSEATREKIKNIISLDFIKKETLLILTNAIYFKGKWEKEFNKEDTKERPFYTPNGEKSVKMMGISSGFTYAENSDYQAVDLPYQGDELSMLVVLPTSSLDKLEANLESTYADVLQNLHFEEKVVLSLPRFKLETEYKLGEALKELGGDLPFSDTANFSGISEKERLKISEVIHKAFVACDEEGTEAAAVTAVGMVRCASFKPPKPPKVVNADHPFLFFIRNNQTGTILFSGRVTNP